MIRPTTPGCARKATAADVSGSSRIGRISPVTIAVRVRLSSRAAIQPCVPSGSSISYSATWFVSRSVTARPASPTRASKLRSLRDGPYHLDLRVQTDFPVAVGARIAAELPRLYTVAFHMSGTRNDAFERLRELAGLPLAPSVLTAPEPGQALLGLLARHIEEFLGRKAEKSFHILDDILRDDITHPIDINTRGIDGDFDRVHPLLWELKRTCLTSVLGCLPPGVRISFILTDLLGFGPAASAALLGINESAYRVRLTRARKRLDSHLAPLCQHVDRQNPCNCEGRLGVALAAEREQRLAAQRAQVGDITHRHARDRLHAFEQALVFALQQQGFGERQCDAGLADLQPPGAQQFLFRLRTVAELDVQHAEQPPARPVIGLVLQRVLQFDDRGAELALRAQLFGLVQFPGQVGCGGCAAGEQQQRSRKRPHPDVPHHASPSIDEADETRRAAGRPPGPCRRPGEPERIQLPICASRLCASARSEKG